MAPFYNLILGEFWRGACGLQMESLCLTSKKYAEERRHGIEKLYIPWRLCSALYGRVKHIEVLVPGTGTVSLMFDPYFQGGVHTSYNHQYVSIYVSKGA